LNSDFWFRAFATTGHALSMQDVLELAQTKGGKLE
jgi:hypothetical protein